MSTRSQQSTETKKIIIKYKRKIESATDTKIALNLINEAMCQASDSIQKNKICASLRNYIKN